MTVNQLWLVTSGGSLTPGLIPAIRSESESWIGFIDVFSDWKSRRWTFTGVTVCHEEPRRTAADLRPHWTIRLTPETPWRPAWRCRSADSGLKVWPVFTSGERTGLVIFVVSDEPRFVSCSVGVVTSCSSGSISGARSLIISKESKPQWNVTIKVLVIIDYFS